MKSSVKTNECLKPHPDLKKLYYTYLAIGSIVFYLSWAIPISISLFLRLRLVIAVTASFFFFLPFIFIITFISFWIPKFHFSLSYLLTQSEIIIEKGVWWKRKSIVPYNRVTNIDVVQGPLSRRFGLGKVSIQTAGFSAGGSSGSAKVAEAVILGIKNFEEVKDIVMNRVKQFRPIAVETGHEVAGMEDVNLRILDELKKIRKNLERAKKN